MFKCSVQPPPRHPGPSQVFVLQPALLVSISSSHSATYYLGLISYSAPMFLPRKPRLMVLSSRSVLCWVIIIQSQLPLPLPCSAPPSCPLHYGPRSQLWRRSSINLFGAMLNPATPNSHLWSSRKCPIPPWPVRPIRAGTGGDNSCNNRREKKILGLKSQRNRRSRMGTTGHIIVYVVFVYSHIRDWVVFESRWCMEPFLIVYLQSWVITGTNA